MQGTKKSIIPLFPYILININISNLKQIYLGLHVELVFLLQNNLKFSSIPERYLYTCRIESIVFMETINAVIYT